MEHPRVAESAGRAMCSIVVIDDDPQFLRAIRRTAAIRSDVDLFASAIVDRAIEHIGSHPTRLAIVDLHMPGTSGLVVCRKLRATTPDLEILIASAGFDDRLKREAIQAGADAAIDKPFDFATIVTSAALGPRRLRPHELVAPHLELARNIARKLSRVYRNLVAADEVEALAMLGLCEAASRFDSTRSEPFAAFAERRIRGSVLDELRRLSGFTRSGRRIQRRVTEARRELEVAGATSDDDVVARAGVSIDDLVRSTPPMRALYSETSEIASNEPGPDARVLRSEIAAAVTQSWHGLSPLGRTILERHYVEGMSLTAIARTLQLSTGRVAHAHAKALDVLRAAVRDGVVRDSPVTSRPTAEGSRARGHERGEPLAD